MQLEELAASGEASMRHRLYIVHVWSVCGLANGKHTTGYSPQSHDFELNEARGDSLSYVDSYSVFYRRLPKIERELQAKRQIKRSHVSTGVLIPIGRLVAGARSRSSSPVVLPPI